MKLITNKLRALFLMAIFSSNLMASEEIHYIGFNAFPVDNKEDSRERFDNYIENLIPIMQRYGMTLEIYDVVHGGSDDLKADVVTFGSVKNMEVFQTFFKDPEFIAIYPTLHKSLSGHQVVFTTQPFSLENEGVGHTLLSLNWLAGNPEESATELSQLLAGTSEQQKKYGVNQLISSNAIMSNKGLAAENKATVPPHQVELWSMDNAHGFLDNVQVKEMNHIAKKLIQRSEDFWLKKRKI